MREKIIALWNAFFWGGVPLLIEKKNEGKHASLRENDNKKKV
jgi:hypothetical protein